VEEVRKVATNDSVYSQIWDQTEQEAAPMEAGPKDRKVKEEIREIHRGLFYRKGRLWVPEGLVDQVLRSEHDTKVAGHMG